MKKVIFLMGMGTILFMSCTSSKKNISATSIQDYYKDNHYAQNYMDAPGLVSGDVALDYIHAFKKHNYRGFGKEKLNNPWSTFDRKTLDQLINDGETDSIYFLLAAFPKNDKSVLKDSTRHPFIILVAIPKPSATETGKGSSNFSVATSKAVYLLPVKICPPPNTGCSMPGK